MKWIHFCFSSILSIGSLSEPLVKPFGISITQKIMLWIYPLFETEVGNQEIMDLKIAVNSYPVLLFLKLRL